jgi:hypothetical protein
MKPQLPPEIVSIFPAEIVELINSYVPHLPKPKKSPISKICTYSPQMERDLRIFQSKTHTPRLAGKNDLYLYDLEDFVLD